MATNVTSPSGAYSTGADRQADGLRGRAPQVTVNGARPVDLEQDKRKTKVRNFHGICDNEQRTDMSRLQKAQSFLEQWDEIESIVAPILFTFFAFFTRMYKIGLSPIVTWDEAQ